MPGESAPSTTIVETEAGVCGHKTTVKASKTEGYSVRVSIESSCTHVAKIADELDEVDALQQIGLRGGLPPALQTAYRNCIHAACPVPSGLIKAIEAAAGLALPQDAHISVSREQ